MAYYLITYDITDTTRSNNMSDYLEKNAHIHLQLSVWIMQSNETPQSLYVKIAAIERFNNEKDKLFICRLTGKAATGKFLIKGADFGNKLGWDFT